MKERCGRRAGEDGVANFDLDKEIARIAALTHEEVQEEIKEEFRKEGTDPEEGLRRVHQSANETFLRFCGPRGHA